LGAVETTVWCKMRSHGDDCDRPGRDRGNLGRHQVLRPRTPVVEVDGSEFGLPKASLCLKLEQLQHSGAFKVPGAFANLLMRKFPDTGVVAASGGNHAAAVAYAVPSAPGAAGVRVWEVMSRGRGHEWGARCRRALMSTILRVCQRRRSRDARDFRLVRVVRPYLLAPDGRPASRTRTE